MNLETTSTIGGQAAAAPGFDSMLARAAEVDKSNPSPEQQRHVDEQKAKDHAAEEGAREWAEIPKLFGGLVGMIVPQIRDQFYNEKACMQWGASAHAVALKYKWKGTFMPELALATCTLAMALPTYLAVREAIAQAKNDSTLARFRRWWAIRGMRKKAAAGEPAKPAEVADGGS